MANMAMWAVLVLVMGSAVLNAAALDLSQIQFARYGDMAQKKRSACFVDAVGRGSGIRPHLCPEGYEKDGQMCAPRCPNGYTGDGDTCQMNCPSGFSNVGSHCASMLSKGCCCTGCCASCPQNYTDIGCFCADFKPRDSYHRGAYVPMICGSGQQHFEGLCYPSCPFGYIGMGPLCWGRHLEHFYLNYTHKCNDIIFAEEPSTCDLLHTELQFIEGGLSSACVAALLGSAVMHVISFEEATKVCGAHLTQGVSAINVIMHHTNAHNCNPNSPYKCSLP